MDSYQTRQGLAETIGSPTLHDCGAHTHVCSVGTHADASSMAVKY